MHWIYCLTWIRIIMTLQPSTASIHDRSFNYIRRFATFFSLLVLALAHLYFFSLYLSLLYRLHQSGSFLSFFILSCFSFSLLLWRLLCFHRVLFAQRQRGGSERVCKGRWSPTWSLEPCCSPFCVPHWRARRQARWQAIFNDTSCWWCPPSPPCLL